jgi:glucosamine-6-phosphate deaminase
MKGRVPMPKFYKVNNMKLCIEESYDFMSVRAASIFAEQVNKKPDGVYGFATGSTPIGMYQALAALHQKGKVDFSKATTFNLDEYYPIAADNPKNYRHFMEKNLFDHLNLDKSKINLLNGAAEDYLVECKSYEDRIRIAGGIDLQLLGIGSNGHIAFNEPDDHFSGATRLVNIAESTIADNARFFDNPEEVPTQALSMGIRTIMQARSILLIASGENKSRIIADMFLGNVTPKLPASILQFHPNVSVVLDKAAAADVSLMLGYQ